MKTEDIERLGRSIADAITPIHAAGAHDPGGGYVTSLTEAVMGVTGGLFAIAQAVDRLADSAASIAQAVEDHE